MRNVLDQPVDRIVGVGALVDSLPGFARRTLHDKLPFGLKAAANVLKGEDVSFLNLFFQRAAEKSPIDVVDAIRSAIEKNRQRITVRLWRIDDRVQLDAVTHGNHLFDLIEPGGRVRRLCGLSAKRNRREKEQ